MSAGRLGPLNASLMTAQNMSEKRGDAGREIIDGGRSCRPVAFSPYDGGMYRKRACAGGAVLTIFKTLSFRRRRCILSLISARATHLNRFHGLPIPERIYRLVATFEVLFQELL